MTRVFITGMGAITPIGNNVATFWRNLLAGTPGARKITHFDTGDMPFNIGCEVDGFDPTEYLDRKTARRIHRSSQFAVAVSKQALTDANLIVDHRYIWVLGNFTPLIILAGNKLTSGYPALVILVLGVL